MDERQRRQLLAAVLDQMPILVAVTEGDEQQVVAINAQGRELVGDGRIGSTLTEWSDLFGDQLVERYDHTWRTGETYSADEWRFPFTGADGRPSERFLSFTIAPVRREDGTIRAVVGFGHDVTDLVRAREDERRRSSLLERRYEEASAMLARLSDAVLPKGLPVPQRVALAARHLLAEEYAGSGGDWFDAVPLPDGRTVTVVGDVVGHGVEASVVMGELKTLFAEKVREDGDVVAALELLDARAHRVPETRSTTMCACVLDPSSGELAYVTAGHPPPVVVTAAGDASYLPPSGAGPLGSGAPVRAGRHRLDEGDLLLLYSDGLVERPGRSAAENTLDLLRVAGDAVGTEATPGGSEEQAVERVCRQALEVLTRVSGYRDDITVVAVQVVPALAPLALRLPAIPDAVRTVRADIDDWLAPIGVSDLDRLAVQHAVGELVTNAVRHAYGPSAEGRDVDHEIRVALELSADGVLSLSVSDDGTWRPPGPPRDGGRGLAMAQGFLDELQVEPGPGGTCASGRHRLSRPVTLLTGSSVPGRSAVAERAGDVQEDGGVLRLSGVVDTETAARLERVLERTARAGTQEVVVDLTDVTLLASAGVQVLFDARGVGPVRILAPVGSAAQHVLDLVRLPYES